MELAIIFLVVLSVTIIGLWFTPWTWGIAAALTAMFVALSIPLIYIIAFMDKIMHTRPSRGPPGKPSCFDENTLIKLTNGEELKYEDLSIKSMKCRNSEFDDNPEITAYIQVKDLNSQNNDDVFVFNGWMFSSSPSIAPFDHPVYDIWLVSCY